MADNQQIIAGTIKVDTRDASTNVKSLTKDLKETKGALADTGKTAASTGKDISGSAGHFSNLRSQITALPGPLGSAASGVSGLNAMFNVLRANPIGVAITVIVGALSALYKAFTSTNDGADKAEAIFSGLGAVIEVISNRVAKLAGAVVELFKGNFSAAAEQARGAFTGIGAEIAGEFSSAKKGAEVLQEVEDKTRDLNKSRTLLNKNLAEAKELISDENASLKDKAAALDLVRKSEQAQTEQELANEKKKLEGIKLKKGKRDLSDSDLDEIAEQENKITELEEKSATQRRQFNKQEKLINSEARAKDREERRKAIEEQKQEAQQLLEFKQKLRSLERENELLAIEDDGARQRKALENKVDDERAANARLLQEKKISREQFDKLQTALDINANLKRKELDDKLNEENLRKEEKFQADLQKIKDDIRLKGITDSNEREQVALELKYAEDLKAAKELYKNNEAEFAAYKEQLDEKRRLDQEALKKEKEKKDFDKKIDKTDAPKSDFDARRAENEQELIDLKDLFDRKILTEEEYNQRQKKLTEARKAIATEEKEHKERVLDATSKTLGNLAIIAGKQTLAGRIFASAQTAIDTYTGAIAAYKSMAGIPVVGPALGAIAAGAAIKNGLDAIRKINAVQVPGQGSGASPSISTAAAPVSPSNPVVQTSTKLDNSTIDQLNQNQQKPVRAYVMSGDIAHENEREARLRRASNLGGQN